MKIDQQLIEKLEGEREELINRYPHLKMLQTEIEIVKAEAGHNPLSKALAMNGLMQEIITRDLAPALQDLHKIFKNILSNTRIVENQKNKTANSYQRE